MSTGLLILFIMIILIIISDLMTDYELFKLNRKCSRMKKKIKQLRKKNATIRK